jgi:hypothetical protein
MKSSISMKSWKTTISLSGLLFLMFALTVLSWSFVGVSMPSSLSSPASPANGSITYDKGANVITVTGCSSHTPCTFTDVYNADVAGGWGKVHLQGTTQFSFDCSLYIGDGTTATYFKDLNKEVYFNDDQKMCSRTNSTTTFGKKEDTICASSGVTIFVSYKTLKYNDWNFDGTAYFYDTKIIGFDNSAGAILTYERPTIYISGTFEVISLKIEMLRGFGPNNSNGIVRKLEITNCGDVGAGFNPSYSVYDDALVFKNNRGMIVTDSWTGSFQNIKACSNTALIDLGRYTGNVYCVNFEVDSWVFTWYGATGGTGTIYRQYTFDLKVTDKDQNAISGATVTVKDKDGNTVFSVTSNASGDIATQTVSRGYYDQTHGDTLQEYSPHTLTITKEGYQTYTGNLTLSQKTNRTIALQPLTDGGLIEHVGFVPVDPGLTSPSGTYRWLDVADQAYGIDYRNSYNYSQAAVEVAYCTEGNKFQGLLTARNLKPNFAYQLKLVGTPGTADNERIGLAGRWWQEEWTGTTWANGQNLNDKGDGSSPNPNDQTYLSRRYIQDSSSPTGYHYRYTGYLVFDYFITDSNGTATLQFETGSCYHVIWKTTQRSNATNDGPVKTVTFDPAPSQPAYDTDYPSNTVSIFGEWERLPMGQVNLQPGEYNCQILLTEESFHGSGGTLAGNWAGAVTANIMFTIN